MFDQDRTAAKSRDMKIISLNLKAFTNFKTDKMNTLQSIKGKLFDSLSMPVRKRNQKLVESII
jgi:hypothetical protein